MRTVVEVQTGAGVVHVSRGAYEFQATFHGVNAHLVALCYGLEHNMAAMDRIERRLIACLDTTAPAERDAKDVLAAVGLLMFERAMDGLPDAEPAERKAWAAFHNAIDRGVRDPHPKDSDYLQLRLAAMRAGWPYIATDDLRQAIAEVREPDAGTVKAPAKPPGRRTSP